MDSISLISQPFNFNPIKHHLGYIRSFIRQNPADKYNMISSGVTDEIKRIGSSVTDIYTGVLLIDDIVIQLKGTLDTKNLISRKSYFKWVGESPDCYRIIMLTDNSQWVLKSLPDTLSFIHFFPSRGSVKTIRTKGNTLKSAIILSLLLPFSKLTSETINEARSLIGLSPVRSLSEAGAIVEISELLGG
ncbi:MAG TPA: hypothetical protein VMW76_00885 [Bacteroidales bacterium]|nr:hypothetical protein [Bacteroidales bacterium]